MTKLMEWVSVALVLGSIWMTFVTKQIDNAFTKQFFTHILISPIIFVGLFGIYSVAVILYRVFTFNNCEEAAKELQQEIIEAKADLMAKGITFSS